jgi:hypothetical protein
MARQLLLLLALVGSAGCEHDQPAAPAPSPWSKGATAPVEVPSQPVPAQQAPGMAAPAAPDQPADADLSGTVGETMNSGGYTYARVDNNGKQTWIAGPEGKLAVGQKLGNMAGTLMSGFRSNTLNRTFDQIWFVGSFAADGAVAAAPANPHAGGMAMTAPAAPAAPAAPDAKIDPVAPAPNGKTIAAVFAAQATLGGKPMTVRGKVVKVNDGIMGKNWVHLRDGTGAAGTNDLLVTTQDTAHLGDVLTATGTVALKQDYGAGYAYDVVLTEATLTAK